MADEDKTAARDDAFRSFARMSNPEVLQQNLIVAGLSSVRSLMQRFAATR